MGRDDVVRELARRISGTRILDTAAELAQLHRTPASPGFAAAVDVVLRKLEDAGVTASVHEYPADGVTKTYAWTAPPAWSVQAGRLSETAPHEHVIADFSEVAQAVVVHSPGGVFEGEVVHLGAPANDVGYEAEPLAGRVVLVCARASEAVPRAARHGAVGVVVYPDDERAAVSHDLVQYQSLFPRRDEIPGLVPAFSISRRAADRLVRGLAKGPVTLRGEVEAGFAEGRIQVIEASVPGIEREAPAVLFTAHLCHPRGSANDNASGAAALVEVARALQQAPLPVTARFLWMPEFYGSLPWASSHADELRAIEFVLNLDMVGASPETIGEPLRVFRAANHTPHFVNALVEPLAARVSSEASTTSVRGSSRLLHWCLDLPSGGSDHLVFAANPHRLPALMLGHDDPYWHTDFDTPDKLDPTRLKQAAVLAASLASFAAPREDDLDWLWGRLLEYSTRGLVQAREMATRIGPERGARMLDLTLAIETQRALTVAGVGPEVQEARADALLAIRRHLDPSSSDGRLAEDGEARPSRCVDGPLVYAITDGFSEDDRQFFKERFAVRHRAPAEGLVNHCDGTKTPLEIALLLSLDAGELVDVADVRRGIALLQRAGYVR